MFKKHSLLGENTTCDFLGNLLCHATKTTLKHQLNDETNEKLDGELNHLPVFG